MRRRRLWPLAALALLALPGSAEAFDTGPHSDITRDALTAEGFGPTAADVAVVNNWFVDLYSNSSKIPQSGHADTSVSVFGALFENDEHWPQGVLDAANRMHFDASIWDVSNAVRAEAEWTRLQRATTQALRSIKSAGADKPLQVLSVIGTTLHSLQDFYSHSTWIEQQGVEGVVGPNWSGSPYGRTPTWFDVPPADRDKLENIYIGESTGHKERPHGKWNTDGNKSAVHGVNKDWPGRPGYTDAYLAAYFASRQWVQAIHAALGDEALWQSVLRYSNRRGGQLNHDLNGALTIGRMTGHWQGQGEPCNPSISTSPCGPQNGLGGDLIGARSAVNDYFEDRDRTAFRDTFQLLLPLFGQVDPNGTELPISPSQGMQAATRFVRARITSMKGVGLRALGDPGPLDRADNYSRATIAGQGFWSGEINGRDSFGFGLPYAPFTFIKAITPGASYGEPVTTMTVEIRTSSKLYSGTDDDVYLRVSPTLRFALDKRLYDDFERGDRDTYSVPIDGAVLNGLTVGDITRVEVDKSPDGVGGGWRLRGVKLVVNGRTLYRRDGIEKWLEDNHRTWRAPDFRPSSPVGNALPITIDLYDEDSNVYGADDHGDLNRYDMRKRLALAYTPDAPAGDRATGGSFLSGRLGDGDKASITYVIDTLPVTYTAPPPPPQPVPTTPPPPPTTTEPPKPPPPTPKPDLVISAMDYSASDAYYFTVTNQGSGAAGAFTVDIPGEGSFAFPGLAPGASATRTFRMACKVATETATADSLGQVDESNESNNTRSYTETVCLA